MYMIMVSFETVICVPPGSLSKSAIFSPDSDLDKQAIVMMKFDFNIVRILIRFPAAPLRLPGQTGKRADGQTGLTHPTAASIP